MALIEVGSINSFAVSANAKTMKHKPFLKGIRSFSDLKEVSSDIPPDSFELVTSVDQRGVGFKSLQLTKGFEGFLQKYLNITNEIYFYAWAWDLSGVPVNLYPGSNIDSKEVIIPIKVGNIREFIGQGINIFPKRSVKGGIAVRIQLWESDQNVRNFGKAMSDTADAISKSSLNHLLSSISLVTGVSGTTVTLIKDATLQLANLIGTILKANGDDYVDFFEGYYSSDQDWASGNETYSGNSSILTLNKY